MFIIKNTHVISSRYIIGLFNTYNILHPVVKCQGVKSWFQVVAGPSGPVNLGLLTHSWKLIHGAISSAQAPRNLAERIGRERGCSQPSRWNSDVLVNCFKGDDARFSDRTVPPGWHWKSSLFISASSPDKENQNTFNFHIIAMWLSCEDSQNGSFFDNQNVT